MPSQRLEGQIRFVQEVDKLKRIERRTTLLDSSRLENSAEHSWHLALMALVLHEYADDEIDLLRVLKMLLVHDIVEIDAGDTFCYDPDGCRDKAEREMRAADRIFELLPADLAQELRSLWDEFEQRVSAEARFAAALDRLQPLMHNHGTRGGSWQQHGITRSQVEDRNHVIGHGASDLWSFARELLDDAVQEGFLEPR